DEEWALVAPLIFFFSSRRRHTRSKRDWSSDVCSSDLPYHRGRRSIRATRDDDWRRAGIYQQRGLADNPLNVADRIVRSAGRRQRSEERRVGKGGRAWGSAGSGWVVRWLSKRQ